MINLVGFLSVILLWFENWPVIYEVEAQGD